MKNSLELVLVTISGSSILMILFFVFLLNCREESPVVVLLSGDIGGWRQTGSTLKGDQIVKDFVRLAGYARVLVFQLIALL